MRRQSLTISVCAILLALTVILGWIPYGGVFLLPIVLASTCFRFRYSLIASIMFGLVSLTFAFILPGSVFAIGVIFRQCPWMPVLPRLFVGPAAYGIYTLVRKLFPKEKVIGKVLPISLAAAAACITNTVLVGFSIFLAGEFVDPALKVLSVIELVMWGSIEIAVMAVIAPSVILSVKKAMPRLINEINHNNNKKQTSKAGENQ